MNQHCDTDWDETVRTCQLITTPSLPTEPIKPVHTRPGPRLLLFTNSSVGSFWVSVKCGVRDRAGVGVACSRLRDSGEKSSGAEFGVYHTVLGLGLGLG